MNKPVLISCFGPECLDENSYHHQVKSSHVINVFRRQGCPHLGQGHGPIVSSRHRL